MRWLVLSFAAVLIPTAAHAQEPKVDAIEFSELVGATIEVVSISQQVIRRDGKDISQRMDRRVKIVIGTGDNLQWTVTHAAHTPRGIRSSKAETRSATLERPNQTPLWGGGHEVWVFNQPTLTFLRTYKGGAFKRDVTFVRDAKGWTCSSKESFAREVGVGSIVVGSVLDDKPVVIVTAKEVSASWKITTGK